MPENIGNKVENNDKAKESDSSQHEEINFVTFSNLFPNNYSIYMSLFIATFILFLLSPVLLFGTRFIGLELYGRHFSGWIGYISLFFAVGSLLSVYVPAMRKFSKILKTGFIVSVIVTIISIPFNLISWAHETQQLGMRLSQMEDSLRHGINFLVFWIIFSVLIFFMNPLKNIFK